MTQVVGLPIKYKTSPDACSCPDFFYRHRERRIEGGCKHMTYLAGLYELRDGAQQNIDAQERFNAEIDALRLSAGLEWD